MEKDLLKGKTVWVTRPVKQAGPLAKLIEQAGGQAFILPVIDIVPNEITGQAIQLIQNLDHYQKVIFLSSNAVEYGLNLMGQYWPQWPIGIQWWAVGKATAGAMRHLGVEAQIPSHGYNSEGLLEMAALTQVRGQKILIVRGESGRNLLPDTLLTRGAELAFLEVYKRIPSQPSRAQIQQLTSLVENEQLNSVIVTSIEALENVMALSLTNGLVIRNIPLIVISQRIAAAASNLGFDTIQVVGSGENNEIVAGMI